MNKKGSTLSGWMEGIGFSMLFIIIFAGVIASMNGMYDKDYDLGIGTNSTSNAMKNYQDSIKTSIETGETETLNGEWILKTSWGTIKGASGIIWTFVTGGFLETANDYMKLPTEVVYFMRIIYFISLGFIIFKILFKINI